MKTGTQDCLGEWLRRLLMVFFLCVQLSAYGDDTTETHMILRSVLVNTVERRFETNGCFSDGENNFEFRFEAIDLTFSGSSLFHYRLKETDPWKTTREKSLLFPSLPPGNYNFEVAAENRSGSWSKPIAFRFTIIPPLYRRWWFLLSAFIFVAAFTALAVTLRNRSRLKKEREHFVTQQRMNEMENQAKQAMMNPHFIFNALNSVQQYINDNDRVAANRYLTKFSRLIRLNLNLVNKSLITLEEELEKLKLYLEIEQLRFGAKLTYEFIIDEHLETDIILIPSMILQPFVENAIWHGLMTLPQGGKVALRASSFDNDRMLRMQIEDNGIGINQSRNLKREKDHKSFGIQLTLDRLQLFGKQNGSNTTVTIVDRSETEPPANGTLVTIELLMVFKKQKTSY
jgi:anti-sigma regulatory factor (Ser/Thr protein kinase)